MLNRRGFLGGLLVTLAAPAIIRPGLLMKVSAPKLDVGTPALVIPTFRVYDTLAEAMASGDAMFQIKSFACEPQFGPMQLIPASPDMARLLGEMRRQGGGYDLGFNLATEADFG
jgi:hypothetical protein